MMVVVVNQVSPACPLVSWEVVQALSHLSELKKEA